MSDPASRTNQSNYGLYYREDLDATWALVEAVADMPTRLLARTGHGPDRWTIETVGELLRAAYMTCASLHALVERGMMGGVDPLMRELVEQSMAIVFIVQKDSRQRTLMYQAHRVSARLKLLKEMRRIPSFRRDLSQSSIDVAGLVLAQVRKRLRSGVDIEGHWSGTAGMPEAMKKMRGDPVFTRLYRHWLATEPLVGYVEPVGFDRHGQMGLRAVPATVSAHVRLAEAREALWIAAARVNERYTLRFEGVLAPHRVVWAKTATGPRTPRTRANPPARA